MERLFAMGKDVRELAGLKLCAIGPVTAAKLAEYGLRADYLPTDYSSEAIVRGFSTKELSGSKILLPRADIAPARLAKELEKLGAIVDSVSVYRTVQGFKAQEFSQRLKERQLDLITFTSSSTVNNFIKGLGGDYQSLLAGVKLACIGPVTAGTVKEWGLPVAITAEEYTVAGLMEAIIAYFSFD
jgi:uroporphyrinogen III methyltransferase/synthase